MSDEKNPPDTTRPLRDELFPTAPTEPLDARGDDTLVLPASTSSAPGTEGGGTAHPADAPTTPPDGREPAGPAGGAPPAGGSSTAADRPHADPWTANVPPAPRGPRVATVVWGFVIVALGAVVLAVALGAQVDLGLAAIAVLAVAGVTLVIGSIAASARRRTRR